MLVSCTAGKVNFWVMGLFFLAAAKIWAFAFQKQEMMQFFFAIVDITCLITPTKWLFNK